MINFEHDKTLIVGERKAAPVWRGPQTAPPGADGNVLLRAAIGFVEWRCWHCGDSGTGFLPEPHASGACERTEPANGYMDGGGI